MFWKNIFKCSSKPDTFSKFQSPRYHIKFHANFSRYDVIQNSRHDHRISFNDNALLPRSRACEFPPRLLGTRDSSRLSRVQSEGSHPASINIHPVGSVRSPSGRLRNNLERPGAVSEALTQVQNAARCHDRRARSCWLLVSREPASRNASKLSLARRDTKHTDTQINHTVSRGGIPPSRRHSTLRRKSRVVRDPTVQSGVTTSDEDRHSDRDRPLVTN